MAPGDQVDPGPPSEGAEPPPGAEFYLDLAKRLKEAHRLAESLPEGVRIPVIRRLLTVTEAVKRDPVRGSERLDRMLKEISSQVDESSTR
ncbi:ABC transporter substrate-binding protein [Nocardiopsis sp. CNT-189]|uniref:ABC transporter substrate-binding protein n=1 Tax=Nocardiopsis oceanisediminis TaxID=2816862 RepID=UPI003B362674